MNLFIPEAAYIDPLALKHANGIVIKDKLVTLGVPIIYSKKVDISYETPGENYIHSKNTVLVTTSNIKKLTSCKPSADFQFSISSSCPGNCEYCYLQTTQGEKPTIKIFANIEDIIKTIEEYIEKSTGITTFECSSITDPIALEHITGGLKTLIEFFGESERGRLRLVTKYSNVDSLLSLKHNKHTTFRFSINSDYVINNFEHKTAPLDARLQAALKISKAHYPLGFILAPIMTYVGWKEDYRKTIEALYLSLKDYSDEISFELIQHRFTKRAKELIMDRFPHTKLDLKEENRILKWGPYGKFKYVYTKPVSKEIKDYVSELIGKYFTNYRIEYFT
ncbi:MAG TPA: spore photoproduct lyase [Clostridiaceae bacterium]